MRKLIVASLLAAAVLAAPACKEPDPNRFETHIERIKDPDKRSQGFSGLDTLTKRIVTAQDNQDLLDEFAAKVIPVFEEVWDDAPEQHEAMLNMLRDVGHPAGAPVWNRAIGLDGSSDARAKTIAALEGIKKAKAVDSAETVIAELEKLIADPKNDKGEQEEGKLRLMMVETLGVLGDKKAVPVLIKAMEQTQETQPVAVHRAAAKALGQIGDPSAVDALLTVTFRVPDVPTTTNIGERSKLALVAIGEPAVPKVVQMLKGEHTDVQKLAAQNGVDQYVIQQTAAGILGAMGAKSAVDDLLAFMPKDTCTGTKPEKSAKKKPATDDEEVGDEVSDANLRAVIANALGWIGDPKAADTLCKCALSSNNPGDLFPIIEALGRVGSDQAVQCLTEVVKSGSYDSELVEKGFELQPRWEAGRFAVLVAKPGDAAAVEAAFASNNDKTVQEHLEAWKPGLALLGECNEDIGCYEAKLADTGADWFVREKAAYEVARLGAGDVKKANEIAKAFKVRDADARVSMAWLAAKMLEGKKCPECITAFQSVLDAEKGSMDAKYQLSVLVVRASMAKLREAGTDSAD